MEFCDGGCLTDILDEFASVALTETQIAYCCKETLKGLVYIHEGKYVMPT
jgi:serine/threonine protein kinase